MAQGSFAAKVKAFRDNIPERMKAVRDIAAQATIEEMQTPVAKGGNMPVDTGFLRASLRVATTPMPATMESPGGAFRFDEGQVSLALLGAPIDAVVFATYGAHYARFAEYGARGRAGRGFVRLAAQNWQRNVDEAVRQVRAKTGG